MKVPILFIVFNRPNQSRIVFESIKKYKPSKLYIASDGPRTHVLSDPFNVQLCRKLATEVNWDCEIRTRFRTENLGCKLGPTDAINWFFSNEESGVILEDDVSPRSPFLSLLVC